MLSQRKIGAIKDCIGMAKKIYEDNELEENATIKYFLIVQKKEEEKGYGIK